MSDNSPQLKSPADLTTWGYDVIRRHMKGLVIVFVVTAILSVTISLLMPVWYKSTARLMPPESSGLGGGLTSMLSNLSPTASRLLGSSSSSNNYDRYLAVLTSDSIMDTVIEEFDLMTIYKTENHRWPWYETRRKLRKNFEFHIDEKYDYLLVSVEDRDPQRAADMTNFFVEELNRRNSELLAQEAHRFRTYVENRYNQVIADLDSAQSELQRLQEDLGIVELPATIEALMVGMASQGAEMLEAATISIRTA